MQNAYLMDGCSAYCFNEIYFGATLLAFAHAKKASKTGFSCFSRCSYRSWGGKSDNPFSISNKRVQYANPWAAELPLALALGKDFMASSNFRRA